ncbi:MAG TPA: hypothetical protein VNN72_12825 [Polyangiaceae bacterium]|nr:hypothetical protein [Polyangiaceae bacterium]
MAPQDGRAMLETMIQSSTVDLFHAVGIAVGPIAASKVDNGAVESRALMAMISFGGPGARGTLGLLVPTGVFEMVRQDPARPFTGMAWVQDSVNQLLGRLKARLLQFQMPLQMGLPLSMDEKALRSLLSQGILAAYRFRTLRGEISVTLSGKIDYARLNYASQMTYASEGDIVLF